MGVPPTCVQFHRAAFIVSPGVDGSWDSSFIVTLEHTFLAQSYCVAEGCVANPWLRDHPPERTTCWGVRMRMSQPLPLTPWLLELPPFPLYCCWHRSTCLGVCSPSSLYLKVRSVCA